MRHKRTGNADASKVEERLKLLMDYIAGKRGVFLPHTVLMPYKGLEQDSGEMIPSLLIRVKVPYDVCIGVIDKEHPTTLAFIKRLEEELNKIGTGTAFERAMRKKELRRCKLQVIDGGKTGKKRADHTPHTVAEAVL